MAPRGHPCPHERAARKSVAADERGFEDLIESLICAIRVNLRLTFFWQRPELPQLCPAQSRQSDFLWLT